jgi:hypothetical protein
VKAHASRALVTMRRLSTETSDLSGVQR